MRKQRLLLIPVLTVVFLAALDLTVVAPILPQVITDLKINTVDADRYAWIVLAYLIAYTVTVPFTGRLSDFLGRIPVFSGALILFMIGSVFAARADALSTMIVGRALQGLGGGAMLPVSMALVADLIPAARRAAVLGLVAAVDTFGWVLGPVWGALINFVFGSWRAIFWLNIPLSLAVLVALLVVSRGRTTAVLANGPNILSAILGTVTLVTLTLALATGNESGINANQGTNALGGTASPVAGFRLPLLVVGLLSLSGFVLSEWKSSRPLLPRDLMRARLFRYASVANLLVGAVLIVAMVNAPLVVALLADEDDQAMISAVLLGSFTLMMTVGAVLGGRATVPYSMRKVAGLGLLIAGLGFASMSIWPNELDMPLMSATIAIAGFGIGIVVAPIAEAAISSTSIRNYGAASGLVLLARLLGMTFGLTAVTRFALERLDTRISRLPPITPNPGESTSAYFERQQTLVEEIAIPITLDIIGQTFLIAAVVCLLTLVVVLRMRREAV